MSLQAILTSLLLPPLLATSLAAQSPALFDAPLLLAYLQTIAPRLKARSQARRVVALRGLFRWLREEGQIAVDPSQGLSSPRLAQKLPDLLGRDEVLALLAAPPTAAAAPAAADASDEDSPRITTRVTAKGEVIAEMKVAAKPAAVREQLAGAEKAHGLAPTTVSSKATADGKCEKVDLQTRGLIAPFVLKTRRCPTATGWKETLVASDNFVEYWNEWTVKELPEGGVVAFDKAAIANAKPTTAKVPGSGTAARSYPIRSSARMSAELNGSTTPLDSVGSMAPINVPVSALSFQWLA